jgi:hypothetical protein
MGREGREREERGKRGKREGREGRARSRISKLFFHPLGASYLVNFCSSALLRC